MKPEVKHAWVEALESDKYQQTTGALKDDDGFCCLGVLCDIVDPNGWQVTGDGLRNMFKYKESWDDESLPYTVSDELDIDDSDEAKLIEMNDQGKSFKTIANYIRDFL